ncbi:MAG: hypothetical protein Q9227_008213 [Pyrenula ochraceoflavens]
MLPSHLTSKTLSYSLPHSQSLTTIHASFYRHFTTTPTHRSKPKQRQNPPRPKLPDEEIHLSYLKGSGPGGQKINKTASAVQLTHIPTGVVVKSQETRSQSQNHNIAKRILAERVDELKKGGESWVAKRREEDSRRKRSAGKKKRRKYRKLEGEKADTGDGKDEEEGEEGEEGHEEFDDSEEAGNRTKPTPASKKRSDG